MDDCAGGLVAFLFDLITCYGLLTVNQANWYNNYINLCFQQKNILNFCKFGFLLIFSFFNYTINLNN
jgi:hypothetical protein